MVGANLLKEFHPLFTLLYSATHRANDIVNMVYRLDAMDAYNKKLVKKISVKGIEQKGTTATNGYLCLEAIELSEGNPRARIRFEQKTNSGIKQVVRVVDEKFDIYQNSGGLEEYRNNYRIERIDGFTHTIRLLNGTELTENDMVGAVNIDLVRRTQIRETILSHIEKERKLFKKGIKCLSLFFIDHVDNYRIYNQGGGTGKGQYAEIFEEEYNSIVGSLQLEINDDPEYLAYLKRHTAEQVHNGYFSRDNKGHFVQLSEKKMQEDASAYDLIMRDKEKLLSFEEPTRFIFSHSALKEGWDNPNVVVANALGEQKKMSDDFKTEDLIERSFNALDAHLHVSEINIQVTTGLTRKAIAVIEHVQYHKLNKEFSSDIFNATTLKGRLGINALESQKSLYDLVVVDSQGVEMNFAKNLESHNEVAVYTKLPNGFYINTPVGHYNPDWAIVFKEGDDIKHVYFVAETKGSLEESQLRESEKSKIACARKHFATIADSSVTYSVVRNYEDLRNVITK